MTTSSPVSPPDSLTPQQIGSRLWASVYQGRTIGQLFLATLDALRTCDLEHIMRCPERELLSELGISAQMLTSWSMDRPGDYYAHFLALPLLFKKIPELKRWHSTFAGWYGVKLGGVPYPLDYRPKPAAEPVVESRPTANVIQFPGSKGRP